MITIESALKKGALVLKKQGIKSSDIDARVLMAHALGVSSANLLLQAHDGIKDDELERFMQLIQSRSVFQPVSQIIGRREFWGREFNVTSDVLDPRPETESIIDLVLNNNFTPKRILDLGTGSGILAITLAAEIPTANVFATDISDAALSIAKDNAHKHGVHDRIQFMKSDWFECVSGQFDLIVSNPPYISADEMLELDKDVVNWEPHIALSPGGDGLSPYKSIAKSLDKYLLGNGSAYFEFGYKQAQKVKEIFQDSGFNNTSIHEDMSGHQRIIQILR